MVERNTEEKEKVPGMDSLPASDSISEDDVPDESQISGNPAPPVPPHPPIPPAPPQPPILSEPPHFDTDPSSEESFQFEGEIDSKINPRQILILMAGVAAGIFVCATVLFFMLRPSTSKNTARNLELPSVEKSETKDSAPEMETETSETEPEINSKTEMPDTIEDPMETKNEMQIPETSEDENVSEEGEISGLMQSSMGKKLTGTLPAKEVKEPLDTQEEPGTNEEILPLPETSEPAEPPASLEVNAETETENSSIENDPDALQFSRKKRKRSYSGDPVLDFDEVTREVETSDDPSVEKTPKANSEEPINVPNPTDETVEESPAAPVLQAFRIQTPAIEYLPHDAAAKLSVPLESISIQKRPVTALLLMATQMSGERLAADWQKLQTLGVTMETPITLNLEGTTLREALDTGLYSANLGLIPSGLALRIGGWEAAQAARLAAERGEKPDKHVVNLEDLAATLNAATSGKSGLTELERLIPQFVHPALWEDANGPGHLTPNVAKSRVTISNQYPSVIQEVELFFDKIRRARNMETRTMPTNPAQRRLKLNDGTEITDGEPIQRYKISEKARFTPIDCDLSDGTTLRQALQEVMRCANSRIIFDEEAIARVPITNILQDADVPDFEGNKPKLPKSILDLPCIYRFEGITMEEAVGTILKNVPLLCYPVGEREFFLTTYDEAERKMLVDFFPVGDLITNPKAAGTVLNGICDTIEPRSWTRKGGAGAIYFDVPSGVLIVRQTPYILYQIEMFLKRYRSTQNSDERLKEQSKE